MPPRQPARRPLPPVPVRSTEICAPDHWSTLRARYRPITAMDYYYHWVFGCRYHTYSFTFFFFTTYCQRIFAASRAVDLNDGFFLCVRAFYFGAPVRIRRSDRSSRCRGRLYDGSSSSSPRIRDHRLRHSNVTLTGF